MFRRRRFSRGFRRGKRRQRVQWLTAQQQRQQEMLEFGPDPTVQYFPLELVDNDFVGGQHVRFAKASDVITYRRLVGHIRIGMYRTDLTFNPTDYAVDYGVVLLKGDYDDTGTWTIKDEPDPGEPGDEDDKWLYKRQVFLSTGQRITASEQFLAKDVHLACGANTATIVPGDAGGCPDLGLQFINWPTRQEMMSTDAILPNGSMVDIKTRRRAEYAEKLHLAVRLQGIADDSLQFFMNWSLRVLTSKWG